MRKKNIFVASTITFAMLLIPNAMCTPVLAGTTQEAMKTNDAGKLNNIFSSVSIGNKDVAYATLNTVAKKTGTYDSATGRNTYAVTADFPLEFRMYFNEYKQGTSGDKHSLLCGWNVFKIYPSSGVGTSDVAKWAFPQMESSVGDQSNMERFLDRTLKPLSLYGDKDYACFDSDTSSTCLTDSTQGILAWVETFSLGDEWTGEYYSQYETDNNGHAYHTSNLRVENIVGKPGDKFKVEVNQLLGARNKSTWYFRDYPNPAVGGVDYATDNTPGVHIESGYIYIPYTLEYDSNGGGTAPTADEYYTCDDKTVTVLGQGNMAKSDNQFLGWSESQTSLITDVANIPTDLKKAGSTFDITDDMTLYAVWADKDLVINDIKVPIYKRVVQNGEGTLPDMTFNFTFEQKSEWEGVSYVSTATQIGDKSVTIRESDRYTGNDDPYVGDLTGKKLYYGKYDNILSDFNPQTAGTYLYLVKESIPDPALPNVTYTGSEYVLKVEVDSNKEIVNIPTITLYKDSAGKKKTDYTTPPRVFDEKHELIFYNTYGTNGGTTPTGLMTNILPFIIIGGAGVGGLTLYVMYNVKRKKKENY